MAETSTAATAEVVKEVAKKFDAMALEEPIRERWSLCRSVAEECVQEEELANLLKVRRFSFIVYMFLVRVYITIDARVSYMIMVLDELLFVF